MTATPTPDDGAALALPDLSGLRLTAGESRIIIDGGVDVIVTPEMKAVLESRGWISPEDDRTRSPAPVSGEAAERAAAEIMGRFAVHRSERNLKEIAAIIQHCAGAGREGG